MGARPLARAVERWLLQPLAEAIGEGRIQPGLVRASAQQDRIAFQQLEVQEGDEGDDEGDDEGAAGEEDEGEEVQ